MISMLYMWTHWSLCDSFWKLSNDTGMMLGKKYSIDGADMSFACS